MENVGEIPANIALQHENGLANFLNRMRLKRILRMVTVHAGNGKRILDVGCADGRFSRLLSTICETVAVEVRKAWFKEGKNGAGLDFVVADVNALPFQEDSFSIIVCASVLEHVLALDVAVEQVKRTLTETGVLIVGYPMEGWLFKLVWRFLSPHECGNIEPKSGKFKDYWQNPRTHKQSYASIRRALQRQFSLMKKAKLPWNLFPDLISFYECAKYAK